MARRIIPTISSGLSNPSRRRRPPIILSPNSLIFELLLRYTFIRSDFRITRLTINCFHNRRNALNQIVIGSFLINSFLDFQFATQIFSSFTLMK